MPAATVDTIFRFEDALATAAAAAFNADATLGTGSTYAGIRALVDLPKTRIEVIPLGFAKASERQVYAQSRWWDAHYAGDLLVTVRTQRGVSASASKHAERVGRVRYLLSPKAQIFTTANLPLYEILSVEQSGASAYEFDTASDTDVTELTFRVDLAILADAFPSDVPAPDPDPEPEDPDQQV